jgi:organic hydroperoxide reductase OsmC/OhrA
VSLYQHEDGSYQIGVILEVSLPGVEKAEAEKIAEEAHDFCPYSRATRGNIDVEVQVV